MLSVPAAIHPSGGGLAEFTIGNLKLLKVVSSVCWSPADPQCSKFRLSRQSPEQPIRVDFTLVEWIIHSITPSSPRCPKPKSIPAQRYSRTASSATRLYKTQDEVAVVVYTVTGYFFQYNLPIPTLRDPGVLE